jgi:regulator of PEP synthase PpsR (kinase-PPPase family)
MDLAVAGDDGDRTRDVAGTDVALENVSHTSQPFR